MAKSNNNKKVTKKNSKNIENNNKNEVVLKEDNSIQSKIIIIGAVIIFLCLFYLLAIHITNKNVKGNDSEKDNNNYSEIIAGTSFNRSEKEYLVVYYDKNNDDLKNTIEGTITGYKVKDNSLALYTVDMSNPFNDGYLTSEDTNKEPQSIDELKINGTTLIKVHNGSVEDYIEGQDQVIEYLQN